MNVKDAATPTVDAPGFECDSEPPRAEQSDDDDYPDKGDEGGDERGEDEAGYGYGV